ncbi:hypothetical protein [Sphaerisporangium fuscum]|uniref:hypothetical protein n=1 Tax=Sphaerisporangium fuscum TaxID=2835868 RepID=UPI001BDC2CDE|nr:hypothetical protein [Sphaerisporangium fuscum]
MTAVEAVAHVLKRCEEGRFPWARAYTDRLAVDQPYDPLPLLLRALIHAYEGDVDACRMALGAADDLGPVTSYADLRGTIHDLLLHRRSPGSTERKVTEEEGRFRGKDAAGCLLGLVALLAFGVSQKILSGLMDVGGDHVASFLHIRGYVVDGHSVPGLFILAARVGVLWWVVKLCGEAAAGEASRRSDGACAAPWPSWATATSTVWANGSRV